MPLLKGKRNIGANIRELVADGKWPQKQAVAIALRTAGVSKNGAPPVVPKRKR